MCDKPLAQVCPLENPVWPEGIWNFDICHSILTHFNRNTGNGRFNRCVAETNCEISGYFQRFFSVACVRTFYWMERRMDDFCYWNLFVQQSRDMRFSAFHRPTYSYSRINLLWLLSSLTSSPSSVAEYFAFGRVFCLRLLHSPSIKINTMWIVWCKMEISRNIRKSDIDLLHFFVQTSTFSPNPS